MKRQGFWQERQQVVDSCKASLDLPRSRLSIGGVAGCRVDPGRQHRFPCRTLSLGRVLGTPLGSIQTRFRLGFQRCLAEYARYPPKLMRKWIPLLVLLRLQFSPAPATELPALFQDGMVLQRDRDVLVWGTDLPGTWVTLKFKGAEYRVQTGDGGRWEVELAPSEASAEPADLIVTGSKEVVLRDILVGDVWLASGQSNMEWPVGRSFDADLLAVQRANPLIREFRVERAVATTPQTSVKGTWKVAKADSITGFSAVAFSFADDIQSVTGVPVGIVHSSWGGTSIESWMSSEALAATPHEATVMNRRATVLERHEERVAQHAGLQAGWEQRRREAQTRGETFEEPAPVAPAPPRNYGQPSSLFNGMLAPLESLELRGVIWYQGESNAGRASEYAELFSAFILDLRRRFRQPELPFLWVQLAAFAQGGKPQGVEWAQLREAQERVLALPATGQAVSIDLNASDINDIHPRAKAVVGRRLARLALARFYGIDKVSDSGPKPVLGEIDWQAAATQGNLTIRFEPEKGGLRFGSAALAGFELAGEDRVFVPAKAMLQAGRVVLSAPEGMIPVAVRYAWRNAPEATLTDLNGLPVAPFRSDSW